MMGVKSMVQMQGGRRGGGGGIKLECGWIMI